MGFSGTVPAISVVGLIVYQAIHWIYLLYFHPLASYPGPGWARLTNLWRLGSFLGGQQHLVDQELHNRYGNFVRDGPNSLLVSDIDAFKSIYGFSGTFEKGDFYALSSNGAPQDPNLFAARTEHLHRVVRKKLEPTVFAPKHLAQYESSVTDSLVALIQSLEHDAKVNGPTLNIVPTCERFVFDALIEMTYGTSMGLVSTRDPAGVILSKKQAFPFTFGPAHVPSLVKILAMPSISPMFRKPRYDKEGRPKGLSAVAAFTSKVLSGASKGDLHLSPSVLRNLLEVDPSDSRKLTPEKIRYECFNFILAGTGSTAASLIAVLYEIAANPEWQSRIRSDIDRLPKNDSLSAAQLSKVDSLQAVLKEALRLHPGFAGPFERSVAPGAKKAFAGSKSLPADTRIWSSLYVICRSQQVFGDAAEEFRPQRWLESSPDALKGMEDVFAVFGRGSRRCIGEGLAWMVLQKAVAAILRKWIIRCGHDALKGRAFLEMEYDELQVTLTPRS